MIWVVAAAFAIVGLYYLTGHGPLTREQPIRIYEKYRREIERAATVTGVSAPLIAAVITVESGGNPRARGDRGRAFGLMQITRDAVNDLVINGRARAIPSRFLYDPDVNIMLGSKFLALQIERMGNTFDGVRAYNCGEAGARRSSDCGRLYSSRVHSIAAKIALERIT